MVQVLQLCRSYQGWSIDYVLDLPFTALSQVVKNTERVLNLERVELVRIALVAQADSKYSMELMKHYSEGVKSEEQKPEPVSTETAFSAMRRKLG